MLHSIDGKSSLHQKDTLFVVIVWMMGGVERKGIYVAGDCFEIFGKRNIHI